MSRRKPLRDRRIAAAQDIANALHAAIREAMARHQVTSDRSYDAQVVALGIGHVLGDLLHPSDPPEVHAVLAELGEATGDSYLRHRAACPCHAQPAAATRH